MSGFSRLSPIAAARLALALASGAALQLAACGHPASSSTAPAPAAASPAGSVAVQNGGEAREQLSRLVERYWDEHVPTESLLSPQSMADALSVERRYLAELAAIPRIQLDAERQQTFDIFKRQREEAVEGFTYPSELLPLDAFGGTLLQFAVASAESKRHPMLTVAEYESWLRLAKANGEWTRQAVLNMREGLRRGYTTPKPVVERMLPVLQRLAVNDSANFFYAPLHFMPDNIKEPDRTRLTQSVNAAIAADLLPASRRLLQFLQNEYLPRARSTLALTALPLGSSWYAFRLKLATGTRDAAADLHRMGMAEVERLHARLQPPPPVLASIADPLEVYKELATQVRTALPVDFAEIPEEDFDIRNAVFDDPAGDSLNYPAPLVRGRPPVLYVRKTPPAVVSVAEFLQLAEPGRHYLTALQQQSALPRFRRAMMDAAFLAGWQLYAATLGDELGLYTEESAKQALLNLELRCAAAMVVDTGIHSMGWTEAQSLDYLRAQTALSDTESLALIDRHIMQPGDGLGCKLGETKFQALRAQAQQMLAGRFDIRDFHSEILENGAIPLDILDAQVKTWLESQR